MNAEDKELEREQHPGGEGHHEHCRRRRGPRKREEERHECERGEEHAQRREPARQAEEKVRVVQVLRQALCMRRVSDKT